MKNLQSLKDGAKIRTFQTNTTTKQQINVNYFVNI